MASIGIRELARNASQVVATVAETGRALLITKRGKPAAMIIPVGERDLEDFILSTAEEYLDAMRRADEDLEAGSVTTLNELRARLSDTDTDA